MITNERQYAMTKAQAAKFREALETDSADPPKGMHPKALNAMREATCSQLEELEEQVVEYEALRSGELETVRANEVLTLEKE